MRLPSIPLRKGIIQKEAEAKAPGMRITHASTEKDTMKYTDTRYDTERKDRSSLSSRQISA